MRSREPNDRTASGRRRFTPADHIVPIDEESERLLRRYAQEMDLRARLLDEMSDGILAHTLDGRILYFNRAACKRVPNSEHPPWSRPSSAYSAGR